MEFKAYKILLLLIGGAIGAVSRYGISAIAYKHLHVYGIFPFGTLAVNLLGCFVIGLLWGFWQHGNITSNMGTFVFVGLLGSFTTFSTFSIETLNLFRLNEIKLGVLNILANNIFGLLLVLLGFVLSRGLINVFK